MKLNTSIRKRFRVSNKVKRVASKDSPVAYSSILEDEILVQTDWIVEAINETMEF